MGEALPLRGYSRAHRCIRFGFYLETVRYSFTHARTGVQSVHDSWSWTESISNPTESKSNPFTRHPVLHNIRRPVLFVTDLTRLMS